MYNTNGSTNGPPLLTVDSALAACGGGITPRTPEILNSLMAMTNPLEYSYPGGGQTNSQMSQMDSYSSSSGSPIDSPGGGTGTTPSVQQTCSRLIRAGLKLSLEMKRKTSTGDSSGTETNCKIAKRELDSSDDEMDSKSSRCGLTMEDEDRRKRRRERNKIAATKCRMKKRERTINLVSESETLETQNLDLKSQVRNLEMERRTLAEMLQAHGQSCLRQPNFQPPVCTVQVAKYLTDLHLTAGQCSPHANDTPNAKNGGRGKAAQQKIPSMNTIKFNGRRSHTATRQSINDTSSSSSTPVSTPTAPSKSSIQQQQQQQSSQSTSQHQITTSSGTVDLGFCEGNDLNMVNDVILSQQNAFAKTLSASDCYSISSPDSGFIKSPVDIGNANGNGGYASMSTPTGGSTMMLKSDYIPNCETGVVVNGDPLGMSMPVHCSTPTSANTSTGMEFILKSELVDGDSPYITVRTADTFLFDGSEPFEADIEQQPTSLIQHHVQLIESPHHHQQHHQHHLQATTIKGHNMLINNNNNCITSNHNHNGCIMPPTPMINHMQDFNNHCQPYIDYALLKSDFLGQNTEFLTLAGDGSDGQYVELTSTDLDSGVTTYTSMTNSNGCLA